jgi:hypothetical protein
MARRGFRAVRTFTCPHHPDGPPRLPAEGYEREELTLEEAYEPAEIEALRLVVDLAYPDAPDSAQLVEQTFGLCCIGHRWKISGFRATTHSEETVASLGALLRDFTPPPMPSNILLAELERGVDVKVQAGTPLPIRIPLGGDFETVHRVDETSDDG